jgi:hypothetical protein
MTVLTIDRASLPIFAISHYILHGRLDLFSTGFEPPATMHTLIMAPFRWGFATRLLGAGLRLLGLRFSIDYYF